MNAVLISVKEEINFSSEDDSRKKIVHQSYENNEKI